MMTPGMLDSMKSEQRMHTYLPLSKAALQSQDLGQSLGLKTVSPSLAGNEWGVV
jgi:hypothetical protein